MPPLSTFRKAIAAAVSAAIAAGVTAYPGGYTPEEVGIIVAAAVVAGLGTFWTPNRTSASTEATE